MVRKELRGVEDEDEGDISRFQGLPRDIVAHILSRFDVKTLSKCRRVCKDWYQLLSDPCFIDVRRQFMLRNSNLLFVDYWVGENEAADDVWTFTMCDHNRMDVDGGISEGDFVISSTNSTRLGRNYYPEFLRVTCDLFCLRCGRDAHLFNPLTGEIHTLPAYPGFDMSVMMCGYLGSKREYIVVAMTQTMNGQPWRPAKLCFSSSNIRSSSSSSWKVIEEDFPLSIQSYEGILINNDMYWPIIGDDLETGEEIIVSLDLENDTFAIIESPPVTGFCLIELIDFKGTLCLVDLFHMGDTKDLILWALISKSNSCWIKKYHVKLDFPVHNPLNCHPHPHPLIFPKSSREGELIMCSIRDGKYYLYNPETKRVKIVRHPDPTLMVRHVQQQPFGKIRHVLPLRQDFFW